MTSNDIHPYPIDSAELETVPAARIASRIADGTHGRDSRQFYDTHNPTGGSSPAALAAIGRHVENEYGCAGYLVTIVAGGSGAAVARVEHYDGSRFLLVADCYENVRRVPELEAVPFDQETAAA